MSLERAGGWKNRQQSCGLLRFLSQEMGDATPAEGSTLLSVCSSRSRLGVLLPSSYRNFTIYIIYPEIIKSWLEYCMN